MYTQRMWGSNFHHQCRFARNFRWRHQNFRRLMPLNFATSICSVNVVDPLTFLHMIWYYSSPARNIVQYVGRAKRICYLSPMRAAKVQASLRIRAVSPEPSLLAHTSSESRGTFRQKARSLAPLNGCACAVEICHDGMLEDTNSLGAAHVFPYYTV